MIHSYEDVSPSIPPQDHPLSRNLVLKHPFRKDSPTVEYEGSVLHSDGKATTSSPNLHRMDPVGPLGFKRSKHSPTTRPSVERTAEKSYLLSDRVQLSSAEARRCFGALH